MTKQILTLILQAVAVLLPVWAADKHAHSAHSHGRGQLELVVQGNTVQANFEIPMESLLGFEHLPKTQAQKKAMADLQAGVTQPDYVLILPKAAACSPRTLPPPRALAPRRPRR